jgi:hypothetical protein
MIVKIALAIAVGIFFLASIPSVIATFTLLIKGARAVDQKRHRQSVFYRR